MANYKFLFKFIVIGDSSVGKSCLVMQFIDGKSKTEHETTIGIEFGVKEIYIEQQLIKLSIWDTAGQESFQSLVRSYYRSAIGVLLCYDMTRRQTFHNIQKWIEEIKENGNQNVIITLVCNKIDLENERQVSSEEGRMMAEENGFLYAETSALEGDGVSKAFKMTAEEVNTKIKDGTIALGKDQIGVICGALYGKDSKSVSLNSSPVKQQQKKECC